MSARTMNDNVVGMRYKKHMVYCDRESSENTNHFVHRMWFVVKNIQKVSYDTVVSYSKYFANIHHKQMKYPKDIHDTLANEFSMV